MIDVSVIIPVLIDSDWRKDMFKKVLRSLSFQRGVNFEVIIVRDGGPEIKDIVEENLKGVLWNLVGWEKNHGLSEARNFGIKSARGRFILLRDSDDVFTSPKVVKDMFEACEPNTVCYFSCLYRGRKIPDPREDVWRSWLNWFNGISIGAAIADKSIFMRFPFNPKFQGAEDYCMWLNLHYFSDVKFKFVDKIVAELGKAYPRLDVQWDHCRVHRLIQSKLNYRNKRVQILWEKNDYVPGFDAYFVFPIGFYYGMGFNENKRVWDIWNMAREKNLEIWVEDDFLVTGFLERPWKFIPQAMIETRMAREVVSQGRIYK